MARIDELITEIYDKETVEIEGTLGQEQKRRIEDRVLAAMMEDMPKRKKVFRRRFFVLGLAAVFLMGLCLTAVGAANPDWDIELIRVMGLDNADTLQLDSGEVEISASDSDMAIEYGNGMIELGQVTVTAVNSIGDKNSGYIRVDTDYEVPNYFNEKTDYIMPEECNIRVYSENPEKDARPTAMGSSFSSEIRDGFLSFMVDISGCEDLNRSYVTMDLKDMYYYPNGLLEAAESEEETKKKLLLEGEWNLQWKYAYKSNVKTYSMLKPITIKGERYYITEIEVSPISVRIKGFRMPWNRKKEYEIFELNKIYYKDGSEQIVEGNTSGGCRNRMWFDSFVGILQLKEVIDTKSVEAVLVSGSRVELK